MRDTSTAQAASPVESQGIEFLRMPSVPPETDGARSLDDLPADLGTEVSVTREAGRSRRRVAPSSSASRTSGAAMERSSGKTWETIVLAHCFPSV